MSASGSLDTRHPKYTEHIDDWAMCRDCKRGERIIKSKGATYLPPTMAMVFDGMTANAKGWASYQIYIGRAVFHGFTERAIDRYMGQLWEKAPTIELTPKMEDLREKCNRKGESLLQLLRLMQDECLSTGRLGLFADMPEGAPINDAEGKRTGTVPIKGEILPYINMYKAESIINWDEGETDQVVHDSLNLVVLDESGPVRKSIFEWEEQRKWRVLMLGDAQANEVDSPTAGVSSPVYRAGVFTDEQTFDETQMIEPSWHGNKLNHIPFVFINQKDIVPEPDDPPLLNLARKDLTIYKGEADYRQTLFMQGQYTFVISGDPEEDPTNPKPIRTGAGAVLRLTNPAGKAEYVGIDGQGGLSEQREALQNDCREADVLSGSLTDNRSNDKESGDALGKRMAGTTASLRSVALSCAKGLERALRSIAIWMGEDPEAVKVIPNLEFSETKLAPQDILHLQSVATAGGPISDEAIHYNIKRSGLSPFDYEDEVEKIDAQEPRVDLTGGLVGAPLDPATETDLDLKVDAHEHGKKMSEEQLKLAKNADKREAKAPPKGKK